MSEQREIEGLHADAVELIEELMEDLGVSRTELAQRIGHSRAHITTLLNRYRPSMTLRTLAMLAYALDARVILFMEPIE